jgi:hypothetical protein
MVVVVDAVVVVVVVPNGPPFDRITGKKARAGTALVVAVAACGLETVWIAV